MGEFIDRGNHDFRKSRNDEYVDKSELIAFINRTLDTERQFTCVTRARRFGKTMAAGMLCAYYDQSCDSRDLFADLKIAQDSTFEQQLNKYPVIYLDVTYFTTTYRDKTDEIVRGIESHLIREITSKYSEYGVSAEQPLISALLKIVEKTGQRFFMIVDEWDAICREMGADTELMRQYVDFLRSLFKSGNSSRVFAGVYMTGILPIIQYDTQSALNNFEEYTLLNPGAIADSFGFTRDEVHTLATKFGADEDELKRWYDGYKIGTQDGIYNPYSVMKALRRGSFDNYWASTGAYESLKKYITMNFGGLKDDVLRMMSDEPVKVDVQCFSNDMHVIDSRDAVLTVLIHLGYLTYDRKTGTAAIPNYELKKEFQKTLKATDWRHIADAIANSEQLLDDTLAGRNDRVAAAIDGMHKESTSILQYNDENSLACTISLAYYAAQQYYYIVRELPAGNGFADLVFVPRRNCDKPAMIVELKWDNDADTAIRQIKEKHYVTEALKDYAGSVMLVGINYDRKIKMHSCLIERMAAYELFGNRQ